MGYNLILFILMLKVSRFGHQKLIQTHICVLLTCSHNSLSTFYFTTKIFLAHFGLSLPCPEMSYISKEVLVPFSGEWDFEIKIGH